MIIWIYGFALVETIDYFLAGTPFQLYYLADNATYEISTVLLHITQYSISALLILYFYDKCKLSGYKLIVYLLIWTGICTFYEWLFVVNKVLTYTGWKLLYSIPTYPITSLLSIKVYHFINKHLKDNR